MPNAMSRLQQLAVAAKARAEVERAKLEETAAAGDPRAQAKLAQIRQREERAHEFQERMLARQQKARARQEEFQRRFQARIEQKHAELHGRRARLRKEDIIAAALLLLDQKGLDGVTLRDVASQLHVQAPALYWHFANKRDMVDGMAQELLAGFVDGLESPADKTAWRPWLRQAAHGFRDAMLSRRDGARIVAGAGFGRARALAAFIDKTLTVLDDAGFDPVSASAGARTLISYAFGEVIEEQAGPDIDADSPALQELMTKFPSIARAVDAQLQLSPKAQFDMGLELILRGLESRR
jgi:TetR/AcrR family transcriptional regulator, tetracycline repressor protein